MYDFHSHILPQLDDGSRSLEESLRMLEASARQGIDTVVATPHFYPLHNSPERFLATRQQAWEKLAPFLTPSLPKLRLGAEVAYFDGICQSEDMLSLRLTGSRLLLLEMPFSAWSSRVLDTVYELNEKPDLQVALAHFERYLRYQPRQLWPRLRKHGILLQANASFFLDWRTRLLALHLMKQGLIDLLGSDCHNMETRPPNLGAAAALLYEKWDNDAWQSFLRRERELADEMDTAH